MSFPRYPKYKDSGVEWLGQVPEHWEVMPLKRVTSLKSGDSITSESIREEGDYPVFGGNGIRGFTDGFTHEGHHVVLGRQGALCGNVNYATGRFWASEHAVVARPLIPAETRWLGEMLRAMNLNQYSVTAAQPGLSMEFVGNLRSIVPPFDEQAAIATFLDRETAKIDALIAEQQRLIELLQEKRQAVISHAVTKGLNPDVPMKDSGIEWLGEVPEHWRVRPLKSVISKIEQGWSPQCESYPAEEGEWGVLKVGCVNATRFRPEEQKALPQEVEPMPVYEVREGDILASRGNTQELVGMATFLSAVRQRLLLSDLLYRFRANPEQASGAYLAFALRSPFGRYQIERDAVGTSASMKKVGQSVLRDLLMTLPPLEEQGDIMASINKQNDQLDELTHAAEDAIALLQERRSALISAAVTGQIDVRGLAGSEAA